MAKEVIPRLSLRTRETIERIEADRDLPAALARVCREIPWGHQLRITVGRGEVELRLEDACTGKVLCHDFGDVASRAAAKLLAEAKVISAEAEGD